MWSLSSSGLLSVQVSRKNILDFYYHSPHSFTINRNFGTSFWNSKMGLKNIREHYLLVQKILLRYHGFPAYYRTIPYARTKPVEQQRHRHL